MTFFLHQGVVVMSSRITHAPLSNIHHLVRILGTCAVTFSSCSFFTVYLQPHHTHVMASHPSPGDKPQDRERVVRKNTETKQKWQREIPSTIYAPGITTSSYLSCNVAHLPQSSLRCPSLPSHHPSNLTSIYYAHALYLLLPS